MRRVIRHSSFRAWLLLALATFIVTSTCLAASAFKHPGILVNRAQLEFVKAKVAVGAEPWKSAFEAAKASEWGSLTYTPHPWKTCECGPYSRPDLGCKDEQRDSIAAYTQALLWFITGNEAYAGNATNIINAWANTLSGGHINANGPVQAAWCAEEFPRGAEIIRYTWSGWTPADIEKFKTMLGVQYLPSLTNGSCENGNKELSMSEALINIGVFNDDRAVFDQGVKMWRGRAPAYIYLSSDGAEPVKPANCEMAIWGNKGLKTPFVDGLLPGKRARFQSCQHGIGRDGERGRDRLPAGRGSLRRRAKTHHGCAGVSGPMPAS
jgi:hypothetical protein